jgi:hypothetical protein
MNLSLSSIRTIGLARCAVSMAIEESRMTSRRTQRSARMPIALSLFLAIILQVGLLTSPAAADAPDPKLCVSQGQLKDQVLDDGSVQWWVCETAGGFHRWRPGLLEPGPEADNEDYYSASTPPYRAYIDARLGYGYDSNIATVSYELFNPNGTTLNRKIGVRLIIYKRPGATHCVDGIWHNNPSATHMTFTARGNWALNCGPGYYEVAAAGRFWSVSLNKYITDYWTYSGQLYLNPPVLASNSENSFPSTSAKVP